NALRPGGAIFLGDLRSLPLLRTLHTSIQLQSAPLSLPLTDLTMRIDQQMAQEKELVIDPELFAALQSRTPEIGHFLIHVKRGHYNNELTKFRYDVVLRKAGPAVSPIEVDWLDWERQALDMSKVRRLLSKTKPEILGIKGIPDARVLRDVKAVDLLT